MDFEHLLGVGVRFVGVVVHAEPDPVALSGHRIDQVTLAEQANIVAVVQFDRLGQLLEVFRIVALPEVGRLLHAGRIAGRLQTEVVVLIDGAGEASQALAQLDLLLAPDAERRDGHGHGGKDADDRHDGDQFGDGESRLYPSPRSGGGSGASVILSEAKDLRLRILRSFAVFAAQDDGQTVGAVGASINSESALSAHSTFACPPPTVAATTLPLPFFRSGFSSTK